jgi:hypothetical protein
VCVAGKRSGRRRLFQLNAVGVLIYLADSVSSRTFLVDTGAAISVYSHSRPAATTDSFLTGPDNKPIKSWGTVTKLLCFAGRKFSCTFILAAVAKAILGVNFLAQHKLLMDAAARLVLLATSLRPLAPPSIPGRLSTFLAAVKSFSSEICTLLAAFPTVISDGMSRPQPRPGVEHVLVTASPPIFAKSCHLDPDKLRVAEADFRSLEAAGIVRQSDSAWAWSSPLHMVPKKDGSWRPCGDYHRLNVIAEPDRYPLPSLADFANKLHGCRYFSVIDLEKATTRSP